MKLIINFSLLIGILAIGRLASARLESNTAKINKIFLGKFEGTGRVCYGHLNISEKKISWKSSFSNCKTTDYNILEQDEKNESHRIVFERVTNNQKCLFPIVEIVHKDADKDYLNWNVTGYTAKEQFDKKYFQEQMTCLMIRL